MSLVNQTEEISKVGSEKGNCPGYEGSVDFALKMEELQAMVNQKFNGMIDFLEQRFEDMNQKIMKLQAMLEKLVATTRTNPMNKIHDTEQRCLKLQFIGSISLPILTGEQIKAEGGDYLQVHLVDNCTGSLVDFEPEASAEVEIVAFGGDLNDQEGDNLTDEKFRSKIAGEREGKKSTLAGKLHLKLNKGVVSLFDVKFRSSARHNSGVFKLGARALDTFHGTQIIEAKTKPFQVKDYRRKYNQKHYPPSASDDVWRLENIGKGGPIHERLIREEVNSVEAFRTLLLEDPERLKRLLGLSEKKWKATVSHAQTCPPDNSKYSCRENTGVVNAVGQVPRHISDCGHAHASMLDSITAVEPVNSSRQENIGGDSEMCNTPFEDTISSSNAEMGKLDHKNLNIPFEDTLSSVNPTGFSSIRDYGFQSIDDAEVMNISDSSLQGVGLPSMSNGPIIIPDSQYNVSDLLNEVLAEECCNNHTSADTPVMFIKSQAIDKKKIWSTLFHISKWLSRRKRIASFERNQAQKKQRVCV